MKTIQIVLNSFYLIMFLFLFSLFIYSVINAIIYFINF